MNLKLKKVDHLHVCVQDREAAASWYEKVLGFTPIERLKLWATQSGPLTVSDSEENIFLALFQRDKQPQENRATLAMAVDAEDFLAWEKHLKKVANAELKVYDLSLAWSVFIKDPDGNPYEITSYDYDFLAAHYKAT